MTHKTFVLPLLIASMCIALTSCNNDEKQIRKAAQGYLEATGNYLIEDAYPYATKITRKTTLPYLTDYLLPITDSNYIKANTPATIVIDSIFIAEDSAWVLYTKTTPLRAVQNQVCLIKEEGKWLVDLPLMIPNNLPLKRPNSTPDTTVHELKKILPDSTEQVIKLRMSDKTVINS